MSIARGSNIKDAQRRAQNKYEAKTYKTLGCKVTKEKAQQFIDLVNANGLKVNAVLSQMIDEYIESNKGV